MASRSTWWSLEGCVLAGEVEVEQRLRRAGSPRQRPVWTSSTGAAVLAAAALSLAVLPIRGVGGVSRWLTPTPGCDSASSQGSCCVTSYVPVTMGTQSNVTLMAEQPDGDTIISLVPGLPGTGVQNGKVESASCCGFGTFLSRITNALGDPAEKKLLWVTPNPSSVTEDTVPTDYCASFRAYHGNPGLESSCIKKVCYKLCVKPQFTFGSRFMPSPNFVNDPNQCGIGRGPGGEDAACLLLSGSAGTEGTITSVGVQPPFRISHSLLPPRQSIAAKKSSWSPLCWFACSAGLPVFRPRSSTLSILLHSFTIRIPRDALSPRAPSNAMPIEIIIMCL
jgi:hypothetical protein